MPSQLIAPLSPLRTLRMIASKSSSSNACCQDMASGRNLLICVWLLCMHEAVYEHTHAYAHVRAHALECICEHLNHGKAICIAETTNSTWKGGDINTAEIFAWGGCKCARQSTDQIWVKLPEYTCNLHPGTCVQPSQSAETNVTIDV